MPIFEYTCNTCNERFSALVGVLANARPPACPRCGGNELDRLVSRFARLRSEDETMDSLTDETRFGDIENDPKAMRNWVREMGKAMDEDMEEDLEEAFEEEMSGEGGSAGEKADEKVY